jgi:hypothetical protein
MPSPVEIYLEKLAAMKLAEQATTEIVGKLARAGSLLNGTSGTLIYGWRGIVVPGLPPQIMASLASNRQAAFPDWPSPEEVKHKIAEYHVAVIECQQAFKTVPETQKSGVEKPPRGL